MKATTTDCSFWLGGVGTCVLTALMLGRLQRSRLYHEMHVPQFSFTCVDGPTTFAHDGEVSGQYEHLSLRVRYRVLPVFGPL